MLLCTTFIVGSSTLKAQGYADISIGIATDDLYEGTYLNFGMLIDDNFGFAAEIGEAGDGVLGKFFFVKEIFSGDYLDMNIGAGLGMSPEDNLMYEGVATLGAAGVLFLGIGYGYDSTLETEYISFKAGFKFEVDLSF